MTSIVEVRVDIEVTVNFHQLEMHTNDAPQADALTTHSFHYSSALVTTIVRHTSLRTKSFQTSFVGTIHSVDAELILALLTFKPEFDRPEGAVKSDVAPSDGGLQVWLTVLGCSFVSFSTFGYVLSFLH